MTSSNFFLTLLRGIRMRAMLFVLSAVAVAVLGFAGAYLERHG